MAIELRTVVETLYEEARLTRLGTEKFSLDGTHTGTGGGNHVTLGGATPADSPLLRRPDLLRSMVTFWQHHPSMSYLFSGQFIGPTSQAPRVDEGRIDTVYELEIAFAELERAGRRRRRPGWSTDCSATCSSTSPATRIEPSSASTSCSAPTPSGAGWASSSSGRSRCHRTRRWPWCSRCSCVRSSPASGSSRTAGRLVRWGTELYDRFLLPWYVRADIHDVVDDLRRHDIDFDIAWLEPFLEFRFPLVGEVEVGDVALEMRSAIEPWHVLGEEVAGTGTARYVDSSVERLQVLVAGVQRGPPHRHVQQGPGAAAADEHAGQSASPACGSRRGRRGRRCIPTIDAHGPLVFDLIDRWSRPSLGGCTYQVVASGRTVVRHVPGERGRGRGRRVQPVLQARAHARPRRRRRTRPARRGGTVASTPARSTSAAMRRRDARTDPVTVRSSIRA